MTPRNESIAGCIPKTNQTSITSQTSLKYCFEVLDEAVVYIRLGLSLNVGFACKADGSRSRLDPDGVL